VARSLRCHPTMKIAHLLAWSTVGLSAWMMMGCVVEADDVGASDEECAAGESCSCDGAGACSLECEGPDCNFECDGTGSCGLSCPEGGCTALATGQGAATLSCNGGGCELTCAGSGSCDITSCNGGGCVVFCQSAGTCACSAGAGCVVQ
jgi:hypothetical protein